MIELLTVIAIIGILASILIPVVGKVRASARNAVCQSNLRQWHGALMMYAGDNNDRLPLGWDKFSNPTRHWNVVLGEYMQYQLDDGWMKTEDTVGTCPEHEDDHPHGPDYISYGINALTVGTTFSSSPDRVGGVPITSVEPDTLIFADSLYNWHLNAGVNFRHNGKVNMVLLGGSVESVSENESQFDGVQYERGLPRYRWYPNE